MSDLKSCPFCGSAKIEFRDIAQQTLVAIYYNCNAEDSYNTIEHASTSREQAVAAWNRRASPEIGERAEREAVARIIDPELFKRSEAHLAACAGHGMTDDEARRTFGHESYMLQINAVLAKADAIIALSAPSPSADALRPGEWEPIETAPKDGRHILLFGTQDRMEGLHIQGQFAFSGYWDDIDGSWCSAGSTWVGPFYRPTHWQPLPAPPKTPSPQSSRGSQRGG
jgi:Lar family restriction alleviation protein